MNHDANVWYDHGIGEGGSIIDLVARIENCSIGEAIRRLENEVSGIGTPNMGSAAGAAMGGGAPRAGAVALNIGAVFGTTEGDAPSFSSHRRPSHENTTAPSYHTEPERPRISIVSVGELKHPVLVDYLRERGIDLAAARKYCHEVNSHNYPCR